MVFIVTLKQSNNVDQRGNAPYSQRDLVTLVTDESYLRMRLCLFCC